MRSLPLVSSMSALFLCLAACGTRPAEPDAGVDAGGNGAGVDAGADAGVDAGVPAPFEIQAFDEVRITSISSEPNFQKAEAEIDWGSAPKASVKLIIDLTSTCYPFTKWETNPPPQGQNWPADCDAFDRNFEFVLNPAKGQGDAPGIELVRAITPFGGPLHLEIDVTDVANALPGKHTLRTSITTWSDANGIVSGSAGGWNVSARLEVVPGTPPRKVLAVIPLFDGNVTTAGDGPSLPFTLPEGTVFATIEYRATGHGGGNPDGACIGPAEEFCARTHTLRADGAPVKSWIPWREDCDDLCTMASHTWPSGGTMMYCLENPCGHPDSVRAPRANWCPGSLTPPVIVDPPAWETPGAHTFQWNINKLASGGSWRVSARVTAYGL